MEFHIESSQFDILFERVNQILLLLSQKQANNDNAYLNNKEVSHLLNISTRTLQTYRDTGAIEFIQRGKKIYYSKKAIEDFMTANTIKKFNTKNK